MVGPSVRHAGGRSVVSRFVDWMVGQSMGWSVGGSDAQRVGRVVGWADRRSIGLRVIRLTLGHMVGRARARSGGRLNGFSVEQSNAVLDSWTRGG